MAGKSWNEAVEISGIIDMMNDEHPASVKVDVLPDLVAHADWGSRADKRWIALASLEADGLYHCRSPQRVRDTPGLLRQLYNKVRPDSCILVGFDFPIGLPGWYARRAGIDDFLQVLPQFGSGRFVEFYQVAERPDQIAVERPFYPFRPGGSKQSHLIEALGANTIGDLMRSCERGRPGRRAAAPIFWTLGAQQVGKAAMSGWQEVLVPGLQDPELEVVLWPFSGSLNRLMTPGRVVLVETYPAEFYLHLGLNFHTAQPGKVRGGKRDQLSRAANAPSLTGWARATRVRLSTGLEQKLLDGFGSGREGEDMFDAVVGLLGMLNLILGSRELAEPLDAIIRRVEGWIFGQPYESR